MTHVRTRGPERNDTVPGDHPADESRSIRGRVGGYLVGLALSMILTAVSFALTATKLFWLPSIPVALVVLGIAQMGVHLVFFLHLNSSPDSTNNMLALALGLLVVFLIMAGSLFIMSNLNHNMLPTDQIVMMQR